jgi:hypothetical protein
MDQAITGRSLLGSWRTVSELMQPNHESAAGKR